MVCRNLKKISQPEAQEAPYFFCWNPGIERLCSQEKGYGVTFRGLSITCHTADPAKKCLTNPKTHA